MIEFCDPEQLDDEEDDASQWTNESSLITVKTKNSPTKLFNKRKRYANLPPEQKAEYLKKRREHYRNKRANETPEETFERNRRRKELKHATQVRLSQILTPAEMEEKKKLKSLKKREQRLAKRYENLDEARAKDREKLRLYYANETPEQKEKRLQRNKERNRLAQALKRKNETEEQRNKRLEYIRQSAKRRKLLKMNPQPTPEFIDPNEYFSDVKVKQEPVEQPVEQVKVPKVKQPPKILNEILADPERLPGALKKSKYRIRQLTGTPNCKFCDIIFLTREESYAHREVCPCLVPCEDKTKFICRICKKELARSGFNSHNHDLPPCSYCGKKLKCAADMRNHVRNKHHVEYVPTRTEEEYQEYLEDRKKVEGDIYDKRTEIYVRNLSRNVKNKPFKCGSCHEAFYSERGLELHERIHSDMEKFPCEICGEIRFSRILLSRHQSYVHKMKSKQPWRECLKKKNCLNESTGEFEKVKPDPQQCEEINQQPLQQCKEPDPQPLQEFEENEEDLLVEIPEKSTSDVGMRNNVEKNEDPQSDPDFDAFFETSIEPARKSTRIKKPSLKRDFIKESESESSDSSDDEPLIKKIHETKKPEVKIEIMAEKNASDSIFPSSPQFFDNFFDDSLSDFDDDLFGDEPKVENFNKKAENKNLIPSNLLEKYNHYGFDENINELYIYKKIQKINEKKPIIKIVQKLQAPPPVTSIMLPGNIPLGRCKIRNCTGFPYCKFCDTVFKNHKERKAHTAECEYQKCDPKNYICKFCGKELKKQSYSTHIHFTFMCQYCNKDMFSQASLNVHINSKHANEEFKPRVKINDDKLQEYIRETFEKEEEVIKLRELRVQKSKPRAEIPFINKSITVYTCDFCNENFFSKIKLICHMKGHARYFECPCGEDLVGVTAAEEHRTFCGESVGYFCNLCSKRFVTSESIRTHKRKIHGFGLTCETCNAPVGGQKEMLNHMKSEHEEIFCKYCKKRFWIPSKHKAHVRLLHLIKDNPKTTSKARKSCEFCGKTFIHTGNFNHHLRLHNAGVQIPCEICGRTFGSGFYLKTHLQRVHEVGITCEICKEPIKCKADIAGHMATHGTFDCDICDQTGFAGPAKLKEHKYYTHFKGKEQRLQNMTKVTCEYCPKRFSFKNTLMHMKIKHRDIFEEWMKCRKERKVFKLN